HDRKAQNVIEFARQPKRSEPRSSPPPRSQSQPNDPSSSGYTSGYTESVSAPGIATGGDPITIAEATIRRLQDQMTDDGLGRDVSAIAKELREWLKYRTELKKPRTAEDFAQALIASGVPVREFVRILKERQAEAG
ncbi:MAG: hypothetical protein ACRCWJ_03780, partial [Casimicrobium sp.]